MAYYKVQVSRVSNPPKTFNVSGSNSQSAIRLAALQLREEGITDARAIEVIGQAQSLRS